MDAKPQRPRVRMHDENVIPNLTGVLAGKTLHHRTKSTPALSTMMQAGATKTQAKKVLGEANANTKIAPKDDSDIGKVSPGKLRTQELLKPVATMALARPATRPLAVKSSSAQLTTSAAASHVQTQHFAGDVPRKLVSQKSTRVLRDLPALPPVESDKEAPTIEAGQPRRLVEKKSMSKLAQQQQSEDQKVIPLRPEPLPITHTQPPSISQTQPQLPLPLAQGVSRVVPIQDREQVLVEVPKQVSAVMSHANHVAPINHEYVMPTPPSSGHEYDVDDEEIDEIDDYATSRSFGLPNDLTGGFTTIFNPKYTQRIEAEITAARIYVEANRPQEDIDDELWDTSMVAEYGEEIFQYMRDMELRMRPNPHYMSSQTEIQWSMRAVLIDWVVQVHQRFNLLPETLFLTVNYIDRFLSCKIVSLGKLQLVGATAIFVAAKYEEVNCPTISEIIYMVDGGYTADELLKAERFMLSMLQFELGWPGPMSFLRRISKADDYDLETRTLAKYFLEVTIMDERFVGCTPSFLAAGAHCMARLMLRKGDWSPAHVYYSNYTFSQLRRLLKAMLECCEEPHKHHAAVFDKYTDKRYKRASTFVEAEMAKGFTLPVTARASLAGPMHDVPAAAYWL